MSLPPEATRSQEPQAESQKTFFEMTPMPTDMPLMRQPHPSGHFVPPSIPALMPQHHVDHSGLQHPRVHQLSHQPHLLPPPPRNIYAEAASHAQQQQQVSVTDMREQQQQAVHQQHQQAHQQRQFAVPHHSHQGMQVAGAGMTHVTQAMPLLPQVSVGMPSSTSTSTRPAPLAAALPPLRIQPTQIPAAPRKATLSHPHFLCPECSPMQRFSSLQQLEAHFSAVHLQYLPWACQYCGVMLPTEDYVIHHTANHHPMLALQACKRVEPWKEQAMQRFACCAYLAQPVRSHVLPDHPVFKDRHLSALAAYLPSSSHFRFRPIVCTIVRPSSEQGNEIIDPPLYSPYVYSPTRGPWMRPTPPPSATPTPGSGGGGGEPDLLERSHIRVTRMEDHPHTPAAPPPTPSPTACQTEETRQPARTKRRRTTPVRTAAVEGGEEGESEKQKSTALTCVKEAILLGRRVEEERQKSVVQLARYPTLVGLLQPSSSPSHTHNVSSPASSSSSSQSPSDEKPRMEGEEGAEQETSARENSQLPPKKRRRAVVCDEVEAGGRGTSGGRKSQPPLAPDANQNHIVDDTAPRRSGSPPPADPISAPATLPPTPRVPNRPITRKTTAAARAAARVTSDDVGGGGGGEGDDVNYKMVWSIDDHLQLIEFVRQHRSLHSQMRRGKDGVYIEEMTAADQAIWSRIATRLNARISTCTNIWCHLVDQLLKLSREREEGRPIIWRYYMAMSWISNSASTAHLLVSASPPAQPQPRGRHPFADSPADTAHLRHIIDAASAAAASAAAAGGEEVKELKPTDVMSTTLSTPAVSSYDHDGVLAMQSQHSSPAQSTCSFNSLMSNDRAMQALHYYANGGYDDSESSRSPPVPPAPLNSTSTVSVLPSYQLATQATPSAAVAPLAYSVCAVQTVAGEQPETVWMPPREKDKKTGGDGEKDKDKTPRTIALWSDAQRNELLDYMLEEEVLRHRSVRSRQRNEERQRAWQRIGQQIGVTDVQCRSMFDRLCVQYRRKKRSGQLSDWSFREKLCRLGADVSVSAEPVRKGERQTGGHERKGRGAGDAGSVRLSSTTPTLCQVYESIVGKMRRTKNATDEVTSIVSSMIAALDAHDMLTEINVSRTAYLDSSVEQLLDQQREEERVEEEKQEKGDEKAPSPSPSFEDRHQRMMEWQQWRRDADSSSHSSPSSSREDEKEGVKEEHDSDYEETTGEETGEETSEDCAEEKGEEGEEEEEDDSDYEP